LNGGPTPGNIFENRFKKRKGGKRVKRVFQSMGLCVSFVNTPKLDFKEGLSSGEIRDFLPPDTSCHLEKTPKDTLKFFFLGLPD
jgi:hypothetical protein